MERTSEPLSAFTATADRGGFHPGTPGRIHFTWRAFFGWIAVLAAMFWAVNHYGFLGIPRYQVKVTGLPREAGAATSPIFVRALPETPIRIDATPRWFPLRKVEIALYREAGEGLEWIDDEEVHRLPRRFDPAPGELLKTALAGRTVTTLQIDMLAAR
jgi:hypothetical protein